jgi:hypothetical protein
VDLSHGDDKTTHFSSTGLSDLFEHGTDCLVIKEASKRFQLVLVQVLVLVLVLVLQS